MQFEPEVFRMDLPNRVNVQMPIKGRLASGPERGGRGCDPKIIIWAEVTEAPDEPAYGGWMEVVASAGLAWDTTVIDSRPWGVTASRQLVGSTHLASLPPDPRLDDPGDRR